MKMRPSISIDEFSALYNFYRKTEEERKQLPCTVEDMLRKVRIRLTDAFGTTDAPTGLILDRMLSEGPESALKAFEERGLITGHTDSKILPIASECAEDVYRFLSGYSFSGKDIPLFR